MGRKRRPSGGIFGEARGGGRCAGCAARWGAMEGAVASSVVRSVGDAGAGWVGREGGDFSSGRYAGRVLLSKDVDDIA